MSVPLDYVRTSRVPALALSVGCLASHGSRGCRQPVILYFIMSRNVSNKLFSLDSSRAPNEPNATLVSQTLRQSTDLLPTPSDHSILPHMKTMFIFEPTLSGTDFGPNAVVQQNWIISSSLSFWHKTLYFIFVDLFLTFHYNTVCQLLATIFDAIWRLSDIGVNRHTFQYLYSHRLRVVFGAKNAQKYDIWNKSLTDMSFLIQQKWPFWYKRSYLQSLKYNQIGKSLDMITS